MRVLRVCLIAVLACTAFRSAVAQKFGHIDRQQLLTQMPERAVAEGRLRSKAQELDQRLIAMDTEWSAAFMIHRDADLMTETEKAMAQKDLEELGQRIETARTQAGQDLENLEAELLSPILARMDSAITAVATAEGYLYVFDASSGILLHKGGSDLMPLVKTKLGIQ